LILAINYTHPHKGHEITVKTQHYAAKFQQSPRVKDNWHRKGD